MKKQQISAITPEDIRNDTAYCLDMAIFHSKGSLKKPLKSLLKVALHRLGVVYSVDAATGKWNASAKIRGTGRSLKVPATWHDTKEQAEDEFFIAVTKTLPPKVLAAFSRV